MVNMVFVDNSIKRRDIPQNKIQDNDTFPKTDLVSTTTISRIVKKHAVSMKQMYAVPFERNSELLKEVRHQYVQVRWNNIQ